MRSGSRAAARTLFRPLTRVRAPAYFLWGDEDPLGGAQIARQFVSQLPDAELELLPLAGHAPWVDDPVHVAERVAAFLALAS